MLSAWACTPELVVVLDEATSQAYGGESGLQGAARSVSGLNSRIELVNDGSDPADEVKAVLEDYPDSRVGVPVLLADTLESLSAEALESVVVLGGGRAESPADEPIVAENSQSGPARIYFNDEAAIRSAGARIAGVIQGAGNEVLVIHGENREPIDLFLQEMRSRIGAEAGEPEPVEEIHVSEMGSDRDARRRIESFVESGGRVVVSSAAARLQPLMEASEAGDLTFVSLFPRLVASAEDASSDSFRTLRVVRSFEHLIETAFTLDPGDQVRIDAILQSN